jgi:hypothetical protein
LFAAGASVFAWSEAGTGPGRLIVDPKAYIYGLGALPDRDVLVAEGTQLLRMDPNGSARWVREAPLIGQIDHLAVSADGSRVEFGHRDGVEHFARFDAAKRTLIGAPGVDPDLASPIQTGLDVSDWRIGNRPTVDGVPLPMAPYEDSNTFAIHPTAQSLVIGTDWNLRAYDAHGSSLWTHSAPADVSVVNITGDGRLVVAAYGDGTIRWHRMTDGVELLAFLPFADLSNWVAWTPEGFYAATAGAQGVLRWHVNRGWEPADSVAVEDIPGSYRPELLPLVLQENETPRALGLTVLAEHSREVLLRTHSHISQGARLYLLTIGIDQYNEEYAKNLRLHFAERDARDLASAIVNTQDALYQ